MHLPAIEQEAAGKGYSTRENGPNRRGFSKDMATVGKKRDDTQPDGKRQDKKGT